MAKRAAKLSPSIEDKRATWHEIDDAFIINPEEGMVRWRHDMSARVHAGDVAGTPLVTGRIHIKFRQRFYFAHRIIWMWVHGEWPTLEIDHINRDQSDNRISNLRLATRAENACNRRRMKNNTSGVPGVSWDKESQTWLARAWFKRKYYPLGKYASKADAVAARQNAIHLIQGEFVGER